MFRFLAHHGPVWVGKSVTPPIVQSPRSPVPDVKTTGELGGDL